MTRKTIFSLAAVLIGAAVTFFFLAQDRWVGFETPTAFVMTDSTATLNETGQTLDLTAEPTDFTMAMVQDLFGVVERELGQGYALVDPANGSVTIFIAGQEDQAAIPPPGESSGLTGPLADQGRVFITRDRFGAGFTLTVTGMELAEVVTGSYHFTPAPDDAHAQRDKQAEMQALRARQLAEWEASNATLLTTLAAPAPDQPMQQIMLPGWQHSMMIPLIARPEHTAYFLQQEYGPVTVDGGLVELRVVTLDDAEKTMQAEGQRPEDTTTRYLINDADAILTSRQDRGYFYLRRIIQNDIAYILWIETNDPAAIRTTKAMADSISSTPLGQPDWLTPDFDAITLLGQQGVNPQIRDGDVDAINRIYNELSEPETLMSSAPNILSEGAGLLISDQSQNGTWLWPVGLDCTIAQTGDRPITQWHDRFKDNAFSSSYGEGGHMETDAYQYIASGNFATGQPLVNAFAQAPDAPLRILQSSDTHALATNGFVYMLFSVHPLDPFELVCALSGRDVMGLLAAQKLVDTVERPTLHDLPAHVPDLFRARATVRQFSDDLLLFSDSFGGDQGVMDLRGNTLIPPLYGWYEWHPAGAISARLDFDDYGLWAPDGTVLLPIEYEDISNDGTNNLRLRKDGEWLTYSIPDRAFTNASSSP